MKVLGIEGGPRKDGNTERLVRKALVGAEMAGAQTQLLKLIDLNLKPCRGCSACRPEGVCAVKDNMEIVINAIQEADVIVFGSPVYMWQVTGTAKVFMDRLCRLLKPDYSSRLNGRKKLAFVYTQGNPDEKAFAFYFDYLEKMFSFLGFELSGRVLATGTRAIDDVEGQKDALDAARKLGGALVS